MGYKVQIDDKVRNATDDEIAALEQGAAEQAELDQAQAAVTAAKSSARSKLKALGLTEAEIGALLA